jgi:hypothetical protein
MGTNAVIDQLFFLCYFLSKHSANATYFRKGDNRESTVLSGARRAEAKCNSSSNVAFKVLPAEDVRSSNLI